MCQISTGRHAANEKTKRNTNKRSAAISALQGGGLRRVHGRVVVVVGRRRRHEGRLRQLRGVVGVERRGIVTEALMHDQRVDGERRVAGERVRIERHLIEFTLFLFQLLDADGSVR